MNPVDSFSNIVIAKNAYGYYIIIIFYPIKFLETDFYISRLINIQLQDYAKKLVEYNGFQIGGDDGTTYEAETYFKSFEDCKKCIEGFIIPNFFNNVFLK